MLHQGGCLCVFEGGMRVGGRGADGGPESGRCAPRTRRLAACLILSLGACAPFQKDAQHNEDGPKTATDRCVEEREKGNVVVSKVEQQTKQRHWSIEGPAFCVCVCVFGTSGGQLLEPPVRRVSPQIFPPSPQRRRQSPRSDHRFVFQLFPRNSLTTDQEAERSISRTFLTNHRVGSIWDVVGAFTEFRPRIITGAEVEILEKERAGRRAWEIATGQPLPPVASPAARPSVGLRSCRVCVDSFIPRWLVPDAGAEWNRKTHARRVGGVDPLLLLLEPFTAARTPIHQPKKPLPTGEEKTRKSDWKRSRSG